MTFTEWSAHQLAETAAELTQEWSRLITAESGESRGLTSLHLAGCMPTVMQSVGRFVADDGFPLAEDADVTDSLTSMAILRQRRGESPEQVIRDFELLARVLDGACLRWLEEYPDEVSPSEAVVVAGRLNRAPILLAAVALQTYWQEEEAEVAVAATRVREYADAVARELNTPLNAASITAQLLEYAQGGVRSAEAHRLATLIRRNLERADRVLRSLRPGAAGDDGVLQEELPFGQVLAGVIADVHAEIESCGGRLELVEPIPTQAVPAASIRLVLTHLVRNAVRHRDPERPPHVRLSFHVDAEERLWWISVADNGPGIPAGREADVFRRPFAPAGDGSGTRGRGLLVALHEVQRLGGSMEFTSVPGSGCEFRFSLPVMGPVLSR